MKNFRDSQPGPLVWYDTFTPIPSARRVVMSIPDEWGDFIRSQWERFAAYAWKSYQLVGKGCVVLEMLAPRDERFWKDDPIATGHPSRGGYLTLEPGAEHWPSEAKAALEDHLNKYSPDKEVLFLLHDPATGDGQYFALDLLPAPKDAGESWHATE
jgi:hypothetical protein